MGMRCSGVWEKRNFFKRIFHSFAECEKWWKCFAKKMYVIVFKIFMWKYFFKYTRQLQWKSYVLVIIIRNNDVIIIFKRIFHPVSLSMSYWKILQHPFSLALDEGNVRRKARKIYNDAVWCVVMWKYFYFCFYCWASNVRVEWENILNEICSKASTLLFLEISTIFLFSCEIFNFNSPTLIHRLTSRF